MSRLIHTDFHTVPAVLLGLVERRIGGGYQNFHGKALIHARGDAGHAETGRHAHRTFGAVHGHVGHEQP